MVRIYNKKYPAFIKPYYPPESRRSLKLPQPFTSFIKGMLPISVLLKDHYHGNFWAVEVAKIEGDLFFQAGWTKFLEDNGLEYGDFIVFQYTGDDEFRFKILRTSSETIGINNMIGIMDFSLQEIEDMQEVVCQGTSTHKKNNNISKEVKQEEEVIVVQEKEFEEEISVKNSGKRKVRNFGARTANIEQDSTFAGMANPNPNPNTNTNTNTYPAVEEGNVVAQGKNKSKKYHHELRSNVSALQNPYFVANYGKYKTNQLYVPKDFVTAYRARLLPPEMIIRDLHGRPASTKFHFRKDKTMWMVGGWRELTLQNNLHYNDRIAFELVVPMGADQQGSYIQLHIFRANSLG